MPQTTYKATVVPEPGPARDFRGLDQLAWLMDRAIRIPGTRITVGLDALLGLLPVGGDFLTGVIQSAIVLVALYRYRVPRAVAARMAANVLSIPRSEPFPSWVTCSTRSSRPIPATSDCSSNSRTTRRRQQETTTWRSVAYLVFLAMALLTMLVMILVGFITMVTWLVHTPARGVTRTGSVEPRGPMGRQATGRGL